MKNTFKIAILMIAAALVIMTTGCTEKAKAQKSTISTFTLLVETDGLPATYLGPDPSGFATYKAVSGKDTIISFIWTPTTPAGAVYSISHYFNGVAVPQKRGGPYEIGGTVTVSPTALGKHKFEISAEAGGVTQGSTIVLDVQQ